MAFLQKEEEKLKRTFNKFTKPLVDYVKKAKENYSESSIRKLTDENLEYFIDEAIKDMLGMRDEVRSIQEQFLREKLAETNIDYDEWLEKTAQVFVGNSDKVVAKLEEIRVARTKSLEIKFLESRLDFENIGEYAFRLNELSARDLAGDFYSVEIEKLAEINGIKGFLWRTERDKRVRPSHVERDGKYFEFDKVDFLPGQEILCRCHAELNRVDNSTIKK